MEEEKNEICYSVRPFPGNWRIHIPFLSKSTKKHYFPIFLNHSGFTLIELIIVIGLIGIMAVILIFLINPALQLEKTRDADRKSDLRLISSALELYRSDQGAYPLPGAGNSLANCGTAFIDSSANCGSPRVIYLQIVPRDPSTNGNYYYCTSISAPCSAPSGGYAIFACLENINDPEGVAGLPCPAETKYKKVTNP